MRSAVLGRVVSMLVLVVIPACSSDDCYKHVQRSFTVSLPSEDPMLDYAADVCRVDADQCHRLCDAIIVRLELTSATDVGFGAMSTCAVRFEGSDAKVDLAFTHQTFNPGDQCALPEPVAF